MLVDTHAHLHFDQYAQNLGDVLSRAKTAGVNKIVTVGIDALDSVKAVKLAAGYDGVFASVGLHPHEAKELNAVKTQLETAASRDKVVAIGECGLDYYRNISPKDQQEKALRFQVELALRLGKPLIFHVRDAYDAFIDVLTDYPEAKGIIHSFSAGQAACEKLLAANFLIGLNGIMTFTKDDDQLEAAKMIPPDRLVLETDCPFLSPAPLRGQTNEPASLIHIAEFLSGLRGESYDDLCRQTTQNASNLLTLSV